MLIEFEQAKTVVLVRQAQETLQGFVGECTLAAHAGADVGEDADGNRSIFRGNRLDGLFHAVLEKAKILLAQVQYGTVPGIRDGYGYLDEGNTGLDVRAQSPGARFAAPG